MRKSLIIVPHPDDDVLSFGGYITKEIEAGNEVYVYVAAVGGPSSNVNARVRLAEFNSVMKFLKVTEHDYLFMGFDGILNQIPTNELVSKIDELIETYKPDVLLSCYPSTHQDHLALYQAFQASMRLKTGFMPNIVGLGEYPFILPSLELPNGGKWYIKLNPQEFSKKCEAFELYKSQLKPKPSPLGIEGVEVLARTRGLEIGDTYAELIYLQKLVWD